MEETAHFTVNGKPVTFSGDLDRSLLWVLRADLKLTGTKYGCGEALCGACTVLLDDEALRSCQMTMRDVSGKQVTTIEGLAKDGVLHPVQQAFIEHDALQCGFCTPGMIMNAVGLLRKNPHATRQELLAGMEDNLCRCGGYRRIVQALETAASRI